MLSKTKEILYVGKATSLHSRVNSYFRGGCVGDRRKLEMLARVWDVEVEECGSPLEAALRENEEIKRLSPHYNRALKTNPRPLVFFSRDFSSVSLEQGASHPFGPFRERSAVHQVGELALGLGTGILSPLFYEVFAEGVLAEGVKIFCARENRGPEWRPSIRELLALGLRLSRRPEAEECDGPEEIEVPEPEQVAASLGRMLSRAGEEYRRAKKLANLLNAKVSWELGDGSWRTIFVKDGKISGRESRSSGKKYPWRGLLSDDYDRISVLQSELRKNHHRIEGLFVAKGLDRVKERGLAGGINPEHDADGGRKREGQRHRLGRNRGGPSRHLPQQNGDQPA